VKTCAHLFCSPAPYLQFNKALAEGFPIASIIEGPAISSTTESDTRSAVAESAGCWPSHVRLARATSVFNGSDNRFSRVGFVRSAIMTAISWMPAAEERTLPH
jgi:hypothetical protein